MPSRPSVPAGPDLAAQLPLWELALRAERKSPATITSYGGGVRKFLDWCAAEDRPAVLDPATVSGFTAWLLENGAEPATARSRQQAVRRFSAWLAEVGVIPTDPLVGVRPPDPDQEAAQPLTDDELRLLIDACQGPDLRDRRDEAVVRFMVETGARAAETAALRVEDVDLTAGTVVVWRGERRRGRVVHVGPQTVGAIDRYLRLRRAHRKAASPALWLGDLGRHLSYDALHKTLAERAADAGITGFHPHRLRHTTAPATEPAAEEARQRDLGDR